VQLAERRRRLIDEVREDCRQWVRAVRRHRPLRAAVRVARVEPVAQASKRSSERSPLTMRYQLRMIAPPTRAQRIEVSPPSRPTPRRPPTSRAQSASGSSPGLDLKLKAGQPGPELSHRNHAESETPVSSHKTPESRGAPAPARPRRSCKPPPARARIVT
jgi:hypothetical protein